MRHPRLTPPPKGPLPYEVWQNLMFNIKFYVLTVIIIYTVCYIFIRWKLRKNRGFGIGQFDDLEEIASKKTCFKIEMIVWTGLLSVSVAEFYLFEDIGLPLTTTLVVLHLWACLFVAKVVNDLVSTELIAIHIFMSILLYLIAFPFLARLIYCLIYQVLPPGFY
jgi:hypothetical protein